MTGAPTKAPVIPAKAGTQAFVRTLPFAIFIAFVAAQSISGGTSPTWWAVRDASVTLLLLALLPRYTELKTAPRATPAQWAAAILAGVLAFLAWIQLDQGWNSFPLHGGFDPREGPAVQGWGLAALRLLALAVTVPLMEELFWRSFLLRWIDSRNFLASDPARASLRAILLTVALFGAEHSQWLAGLLAGAAYTAVYVRTRNILLTTLSHAITNSFLGIWILSTGNWRFW